MGLAKYAEKRDFKKTAEPKAGKSKDKDHLIFVVQKHDASRLHYDFRLEMDGVLKAGRCRKARCSILKSNTWR